MHRLVVQLGSSFNFHQKSSNQINESSKIASTIRIAIKRSFMTKKLYFSYSLMGSSGSGKTTLITSLLGICKLDSGDIKLFGDTSNRCHPLRIGYMPQETAMIENFTIKEMIWFFGKIYGLKSKEIVERLEFLSALFELPDVGKTIKDCSGGEKRRVSLAVAIFHEPKMLILDEPTVGLDFHLRNTIWEFFTKLATTKNVTILLSTHSTEEAKRSNRVGFMRNGVMAYEGSPQKILQIYKTSDMDEVFVKLCENQEKNILNPMENHCEELSITEEKVLNSSKLNLKSSKVFQALLMKCFLEILKNFK